MGSLPPSDLPNGKENGNITVDALHDLFHSQKRYLDHFFLHLNHTHAHRFFRVLLDATGTIFFTGVGKSGFVAQKIAQTLISLSVKSAFLSPTDALHGDIGALVAGDLLVFFSKSGSSDELRRLVPCARARGAYLIAVTSDPSSPLAEDCDLSIHLPLEKELCPFDLAPVTSTTIQMLFGDTIAVAIMKSRSLTREEYASNHPAGRIGKSLIFKVKDMMKKQEDLPLCKEGDLIINQLLRSKGFGCLLVIDDEYHLIGTFTDGDLRRTLEANREATFTLRIGDACNRKPRTIGPEAMAVDAMKKMESPPSPVQFLPVINDQNIVIGMVTLHDLVSAGL